MIRDTIGAGSFLMEHRMAEQSKSAVEGGDDGGGTATIKPKKAKKPAQKPVPNKNPPGFLPPWKVLLHNDDKNAFEFVIGTIVELTPLDQQQAELRTKEADKTGVALLLTTHKELAELYQDQFQSKGLVVTIEPAEGG
jgi:ATP-dependent Clp protease adapter protein ClpS